jgi:hypothetical protein
VFYIIFQTHHPHHHHLRLDGGGGITIHTAYKHATQHIWGISLSI